MTDVTRKVEITVTAILKDDEDFTGHVASILTEYVEGLKTKTYGRVADEEIILGDIRLKAKATGEILHGQ